MSRTLLRSSQAMQVLLRHIENIYLSQAALHKTNHLKPLVTNSPLCLQWSSRYTAPDLHNRRHEKLDALDEFSTFRQI